MSPRELISEKKVEGLVRILQECLLVERDALPDMNEAVKSTARINVGRLGRSFQDVGRHAEEVVKNVAETAEIGQEFIRRAVSGIQPFRDHFAFEGIWGTASQMGALAEVLQSAIDGRQPMGNAVQAAARSMEEVIVAGLKTLDTISPERTDQYMILDVQILQRSVYQSRIYGQYVLRVMSMCVDSANDFSPRRRVSDR